MNTYRTNAILAGALYIIGTVAGFMSLALSQPLRDARDSDKLITGYIPLAFPIFLQETVLAVWLIVKGFNPPVSAARAGKAETNQLLSAA